MKIEKPYTEIFKDILISTHKEIFDAEVMTKNSINQSINKFINRTFNAKDLLIQGEIDEEHYNVIKKDCEKSISKLGERLQKSVIMTRNNRMNIKKAINLFSNPGLLLSKLDADSRMNLLSIFIKKDDATVINMEFSLSSPIRIVYGMSYTTPKLVSNRNDYKSFLPPEFRSKNTMKILKIEKEKGGPKTIGDACMICDFLEEYARLVSNIILKSLT